MKPFLRIAYALPGTALSGGVKVVLEQVSALNRLPGIEAVAVAQGSSPAWFRDRYLRFIHSDPLTFDFSPFDVVITTFYTQQRIYDEWDRKPLLHLCQGYEGDYTLSLGKPELQEAVERFYHRTRLRICVNDHVRRRLAGYRGMNVKIGQGLNRHIFAPDTGWGKERREKRVLIVGAYELPFKGVRTALEAAAIARDLDPEVRIIRACPADTRSVEGRLVAADEYHVAVSPERMAQLYRAAALTVYLPEAEGFGLPVLESMACGTPVVASDIPPFREIARNRYPLFKQRQPEAIAGIITDLLGHREKRMRLGQVGLDLASGFSYKRVLGRLVPLLFLVRCRTFTGIPPHRLFRNRP